MTTAQSKLLLAGLAATFLAGPVAAAGLPTLDGEPPLIIGHRGLPGLVPEETAAGYELAAHLGTDSFEEDLHLTKDCTLIARHNPWLSDNTNIAEIARTNPELAARKRTVPGRMVTVAWPQTVTSGPGQYPTDLTDPNDPKSVLKSLVVDGEDHTGDWSITDFTAAELKQWLGGTTYDARAERPTTLNGRLPIMTFQEIVDLAKVQSERTRRTISVYPETKNPTWNNAQAIANGCGPAGSRPLEDALIKTIEQNGMNAKTAPIFVQSFEPGSLKYMVQHGLKTKVVQLVDGDSVDLRTGAVTFNNITDGRPFDWTLAGNPHQYDTMVTPAGLAEIKTYADGIGPWKPYLVPWKVTTRRDANADGTPYKPATSDATSQPSTTVIADAHKAGLFVHAFTFRNEHRYLPGSFGDDPLQEYLTFFRAGVDGVFSDFTLTAVEARSTFLKSQNQ